LYAFAATAAAFHARPRPTIRKCEVSDELFRDPPAARGRSRLRAFCLDQRCYQAKELGFGTSSDAMNQIRELELENSCLAVGGLLIWYWRAFAWELHGLPGARQAGAWGG
jgi:hypothetical protein